MKKTILSLIAVAGIAAAARVAPAQSYNPFQIGASGGVALPSGDLGSGTNTGYNIAFVAGYKPQFSPLGIRAEAAYNQFGFSSGGGGNINIPSFTGNVDYAIPIGSSFTPYVIGGAGLYRPSVDLGGGNTGAENHFGWNVGGGIKIPVSSSFETFVEARYNSVSVNNGTLTFVPITFGVLF